MATSEIELGLRRLGFDDKEAKVYMATLELGPSPVQKISERASVPRATTYLVLDALRQKGLVTTFDRGKKTFFVAESPHQLASLVADRAAEVQQQQILLKELVPLLDAHGQFKESTRPVVRYYEGPQALKSYVRDMLFGSEDTLYGIFSHDDAEFLLKKAGLSWDDIAAMRKRSKVDRRIIYTWRKESPDEGRHGFQHEGTTVHVPYDNFPCQADIAIKGTRVGYMPYSDPIRGVIIEDAAIASMMRLLFDRLWEFFSSQLTSVKNIDNNNKK